MIEPESKAINEFFLTYTKSGGIAGIQQTVTIDSKTNNIMIIGNNVDISKKLDDYTLEQLGKTIEKNEFFKIDSKIDSQRPICPDCMRYTLEIVSDNETNMLTWHDGSKITQNHQEIISEIKKIIQGS